MLGPALLDLQERSHTTIAQFSVTVSLQVDILALLGWMGGVSSAHCVTASRYTGWDGRGQLNSTILGGRVGSAQFGLQERSHTKTIQFSVTIPLQVDIVGAWDGGGQPMSNTGWVSPAVSLQVTIMPSHASF